MIWSRAEDAVGALPEVVSPFPSSCDFAANCNCDPLQMIAHRLLVSPFPFRELKSPSPMTDRCRCTKHCFQVGQLWAALTLPSSPVIRQRVLFKSRSRSASSLSLVPSLPPWFFSEALNKSYITYSQLLTSGSASGEHHQKNTARLYCGYWSWPWGMAR